MAILTAIGMGVSGELARIWDAPKEAQAELPAATREDVVRLLKELADLKAAGLLTEEEFDEKRRKYASML